MRRPPVYRNGVRGDDAVDVTVSRGAAKCDTTQWSFDFLCALLHYPCVVLLLLLHVAEQPEAVPTTVPVPSGAARRPVALARRDSAVGWGRGFPSTLQKATVHTAQNLGSLTSGVWARHWPLAALGCGVHCHWALWGRSAVGARWCPTQCDDRYGVGEGERERRLGYTLTLFPVFVTGVSRESELRRAEYLSVDSPDESAG